MKLPIRSPIYKLTRDLKPLLSPDLRVLEDFELLLCIATWHALPCLPLIAPSLPLCHSLGISVSSLVCLSLLPCLSLRAFLFTSMCFVVDLCVYICLADLAHGQWTSKLRAATAVFLKYCQTKGYKFSAYLVVTNQAMVIVPYNDRQGCKLLMVWSKEGKGKRLPAH